MCWAGGTLLQSASRRPFCQGLTHAYFPADAIVSLLHILRNGESAEVSIVGKDGFIGVSRLMGGHITILDRAGLERLACECYGVVRKETERLINSSLKLQQPLPADSSRPRNAQATWPVR